MGPDALEATEQVSSLWQYLTTAEHWWGPSGIGARLVNHVWLSIVSVALAAVLALVPAVWIGHRPGRHPVAATIANLGRAIPSFALLALLLPLSISWGFGLGFWPTAATMVVLAVPPIFVNALTGMTEVPEDVRDAARGMGMRPWEQVRRVEWPLALPLALAGLRIATLQVIATATLGALVAFSGLGSFIEEGRASFDEGKTWTGTSLVIVAALLSQLLFLAAERRATRWRRAIR